MPVKPSRRRFCPRCALIGREGALESGAPGCGPSPAGGRVAAGGGADVAGEAESGTHAALCAAGVSVEIILEGVPRFDAVLKRHDFVVMARPAPDSFRVVASAMATSGGCLLRILERPEDGGVRGPRLLRKVALAQSRPPLWLSRLPRRVPVHGWRRRASSASVSPDRAM